MQLIDPALLETFSGGKRVDLRGHADHAGDVPRFGLGAGHASEAGCNEEQALHVFACSGDPSCFQLLACRIHDRDRRPVHDALRSDVHVGAGGHLSVLGHPQGIEPFPVVRLGIVRDHHTIGYYRARSILVARKEPQRESGIDGQGLLLGHRGQILHREPILRPVLEDGPVAAVGNEFVRVLGDARIQVVLDHRHDGGCLARTAGIFIDRAGIDVVGRPETVHVDPSEVAKFPGEFGRQHFMEPLREITQGILQRKGLFFVRENVLPLRRMVDVAIVRLGCRQSVLRDSC